MAFSFWHCCSRPPWRTIILALSAVSAGALAYDLWQPGVDVSDGRHDLRTNGLWMQHGWLGADSWFTENDRNPARFRDTHAMKPVVDQLKRHGVRDLFPHLCPCSNDGRLPAVDHDQTERFLDAFAEFRVLPWIGGVNEVHCRLDVPKWRSGFITSALDLVRQHPRLAGVHVNIEPMPSGERSFLTLLAELKHALPPGKIVSVAAYPPPTRWHPVPDVHWEKSYFQEVASHCDHLAVMAYDTAICWEKPYRRLMADWTQEVLAWAGDTPVLIGVPAYDDADTGYHHPDVENLANALQGLHAGLIRFPNLPRNYLGISMYSEWEMSEDEWNLLEDQFGQQVR